MSFLAGFGWFRVVSGWIWVVSGGFGWVRVVLGGFGWFQVLSIKTQTIKAKSKFPFHLKSSLTISLSSLPINLDKA